MNIEKIATLGEDESVIRLVRRSGIVYIPRSGAAFFLIAAPFFFMIPLFSLRRYGAALFGVLIAAGVFYAVRLFWHWYWNAFVITTRRVIDIDQRGFFERIVSEAPHDRIQDVSYRVRGVVGTLCNYGSVVIQTAGSTTNLELPCVRDPKAVQHLIAEAVHDMRRATDGAGEDRLRFVASA